MSVATPVSGDLKPEQGKSFEIGAKYENSGFNATLALFNISKRNVAESVGSGSNAQLNIVGKQRSRGVEFDLNGQITDSLSVAANYTYTTKNVVCRRYSIAHLNQNQQSQLHYVY